MPMLVGSRSPALKWLAAAWMLLCGAAATLAPWGVRYIAPGIYLAFLPWQVYWLLYRRYLLAGGALVLLRGFTVQRRLALATAEIVRLKPGVLRLRWQEQRSSRALTLRLPPAFADAVERAAQQAAGADPTDAAPSLPVGVTALGHTTWYVAGVVLGTLALFAAAFVLRQTLILAPLLGLPFIMEHLDDQSTLTVYEDRLWLLGPGARRHAIPLDRVQGLQAGAATTTVQTADREYPRIQLNLYLSSEVIRTLKRYLAHRRD